MAFYVIGIADISFMVQYNMILIKRFELELYSAQYK